MPTLDVLAVEFGDLARGLRRAADDDLLQEVTDAIHHAADPIPEIMRLGLPPIMPDRYAAVLDRDLATGVQLRRGRRDPGVTVYARNRGLGGVKRRRLRRLDQGILAHPLFGNRERWFYQPIRDGWFTRPNEDAEPRVRREIENALEHVKDKIYQGIHGL